MGMSDALWRFWEGLGEGLVDWDFLLGDSARVKERDRARGWVVDRGFVHPYGVSQMPEHGSRNWKVVCGANMNPVVNERRWYFDSFDYADGFMGYLSREGRVNMAAGVSRC